MNKLKYVLISAAFIIGLFFAWYVGYKTKWVEKKQETSVNVVLEKIQKVFKLVTVEGHLSEIYNYKDYYNWDIPIFRKKALVRVNAKVSAGYDFEKMDIQIDEATQTITISNFPQAEILSLEHDLDYYDITQGTFNGFTNKDYNQINQDVKEYARSKALDSEMIDAAEKQKEEIVDMLKTIIEATGWNVVVKESAFLD